MSDQDYYKLTPDTVLDAIESLGIQLDGSMLTLNSYENRVYRVREEDGTALVAKFYRPGRWSNEQIAEEHAFSQELSDAEIPVVAPLVLNEGKTLLQCQSYRFSLFPCHDPLSLMMNLIFFGLVAILLGYIILLLLNFLKPDLKLTAKHMVTNVWIFYVAALIFPSHYVLPMRPLLHMY